jgi:glutamate/tyrosine decarboxylase-like PLP-dependent enzyme
MPTALPKDGIIWKELERELMAARLEDMPWRRGTTYTYWPDSGDDLPFIAKEAASLMGNQRVIGRRGNPAPGRIEQAVKDMVLDILQAPAGATTTLTGGGTESNFHAVQAARDWARETRQIAGRPEIIVPYASHPSFDKAAHALDVTVVRVREGDDFRIDPNAMAAAITERTIMLVANAPSFPYGRVDPVEDIAGLAQARGLWCHVDACIGGFLIPFLRRLGPTLPNFDLTVPGVCSIAADLHKYGLAPTGISTFTLRDAANLRYQVFRFERWPAGEYATETFAGSRNAAPIAAAWAVMRHLGEAGYLAKARAVIEQSRLFAEGIRRIPGLKPLTEPEAGIFLYTSDELDIVAVADGMTERGFPSRWMKEPAAIHIMISPNGDRALIDEYVAALGEVAAKVRAGTIKRRSSQSVYA